MEAGQLDNNELGSWVWEETKGRESDWSILPWVRKVCDSLGDSGKKIIGGKPINYEDVFPKKNQVFLSDAQLECIQDLFFRET